MVQEIVDDIVITGLACRLPESDNAEEFWRHLINKEDMVTEDGRRWKPGLHGLPKRSGKLKDISHFDAQFFGVHAKQAHTMDPQLRILLELTYEALIDAGIDPQTVRNSKTGVFIGASGSEAGEAFSANTEEVVGYGMTGCCRAMFANRVSFTFDFKGPSFAIDTACSSSLLAMDCAVQSIRSGTCNAAVVGGVSLTLKPNTAVDFLRLNMLSPDGACKSFDVSGNGYCRSEGAIVIYLVKKSVAKRIYAHVVNSGTNSDGYKTQGVTYPSGAIQKALLEQVYAEAKINPGEVSYVEAHGTGTKAGDPEELNAITDVFCSCRPACSPALLIGSVKSNMGHPEPASGLAGVTKVVLAMQHGVIPPNLHFNTPNPDIPALFDGRLKVVTEPTEWNGGLVAINSFGFGGSNVHVILRSPNNKHKKSTSVQLPTMIPCSGRTEESVQKICRLARANSDNNSLFSLLQDISNTPLNTFPYRGYTVVNSAEKCEEVSKIQMTNPRPIWFVFSGMGTQWHGMGHKLIQLPTFRQSIRNSTKALKDIGATVDLEKLIVESDGNTYNNTLNSFIGMAAIQIALVDCLRKAGVHPDGIIGHSVGELGCAYADGSFTAEEAIKAAYCRGKCIEEAKLPPGAMAAVGLTWEEAKRRCPPGVLPACHNAEDTVTISGEAVAVANFVQELKNEDIFAREVRTSGVAFHSYYMAAIAPLLQASLEKFISNKKRSSKWLSTSIPEEKWDSDLAQYSSAAYHANNLISPVLFQEALKKVPEHAIVIEIAPHCLLQAILKRSLSTSAVIVPLMKRGHTDNLEFFMSNLGKLYMNGVNVDATGLTCSRKEYPVPVSVPSIAPHIGWDHSQEWDVPTAERFPSSASGGSATSTNFTFEMSPTSPDKYLEGHCIDGRVLFPATGYLVLAWKTLAKFVGLLPEHLPVAFEDVTIHRATILPKTGAATLTVHYMPSSNKFDVSEGETLTVSGKVYVPENPILTQAFREAAPNKEDVHLTSDCIYKELRLRGYDYGPTFQGIIGANSSGTKGELLWNGNWVSFLDTMLQISVLRLPGRGLRLPTRIRSLCVDPSIHLEVAKEGTAVVRVDPKMDMVVAGGVELRGLHATVAPRRQDAQVPLLESFSFVPYIDNSTQQEPAVQAEVDNKQVMDTLGGGDGLKILLDIVIENRLGTSLTICEVGAGESKVFVHVAPLIALHPMIQLKYTATDKTEDSLSEVKTSAEENHIDLCIWDVTKPVPNSINKSDLLIACSLRMTQLPELSSIMSNIKVALKPQGFLILHYFGSSGEFLKSKIKSIIENEQFAVVSVKNTNVGTSLVLCRVASKAVEKSPIILDIDETFEWVGELQSLLNTSDKSQIWLRCCDGKASGIVGMTNCLRQEQGGERIRCLFDPSGISANDIKKDLHAIQKLDLVMNVYKDGQLGSYRHLLMDDIPRTTETTEHAYVNVLTRGDLSSLRWIASHLKYAPGTQSSTELCKVNYTSLNFRDIMLATGKLPPDALPGDLAHQDCILGMEFSGRNQSEQRIMGLLPAQALATTVMADQRFTWQVPDSWSLLEAASVPVVYATAYYALIVRARMRSGESVLIHSGSGGVGQAAISICLSMGCKVYATVGTKEKRDYLLKTFPQLNLDNIGNSRDLTFEEMIMYNTNGQGVDIVLNSLAEEKLQASLRCLARHGRFLEIGKYDLSNNTPLGMALFLKNISFHGILLDAIFEDGNQDWKQVSQLLTEGIKSGAVRPLKSTVFDRDEIEEAFRFMAQGKHIGKVVIQVRPENESNSIVEVVAHARSMCDPRKSYIITGGLGGFGLELAHWLVERGARNLVLTSRRGIRTGYQARRVKVWQEMGTRVVLSTNNVGMETGAQAVIDEAQALGPLGGIFHLAVVLRDSIFENQTRQMFNEVAVPKYHGTIFLDRLSRQSEIAKDCDWFVVFSSVSSGRGNAGQANYGFANSAMERICDKRVEDGLPGLAIQWGAIGDVGLIQDTMGGSNETVIGGTLPQRMSSCLTVLDRFLSQAQPVVSSYVLAAKVAVNGEKGYGGDLVSSVAHILGVKDVDSINPDITLADLGLDSLMGVEVRQTLERDYDIHLPMKEVRLLTVNKMRELASGGSSDKPPHKSVEGQKGVNITEQPKITEQVLLPLNECNNGDKPLFVVHNINGTVKPLRSLASKLSKPVYGLQYTPAAPRESITKLATFYIQRLRQVQPQGPYILIGYSFGACVAIEMAIQLEKTNEVENLVLLDGSHTYVEAHTVWHRKRLTVEEGSWGSEAVAEGLCALAPQYAKVDKIKLLEELQAEKNINKQIAITASAVAAAESSLTKDGMVWTLTSFLNLLRMGEQYKVTAKYHGRVTLIRAKTAILLSKDLGDDFRLHEICCNEVTLKWVDGDHESFIQGNGAVEVANIITEALA